MRRRMLPLTIERNPDILCNRLPGDTSTHHRLSEYGKGACSACCEDGATIIVNKYQLDGYIDAGTYVQLLAVTDTFPDWLQLPPYENLDASDMEDLQRMRRKLKAGEAIVVLVGVCGYLDKAKRRCKVISEPDERSRSCYEFQDGSMSCMKARGRAGFEDLTYASGHVIVPQRMPDHVDAAV